jgi:uncharacterized protein with ParB-like and HNH nuclease domain
MTGIQTIESHDISLGKLFDDFYIVPDYQREYVWGEEEVIQLLEDVHTEYASSQAQGSSEYFIGSIVVCARPDRVLELIDGQQRMTTTYLFLCAVRDHLQQQGVQAISQLSSQIAASDIDESGNDIFRYRLDLQYEDSGRVMEAVAEGKGGLEAVPNTTLSIENIKGAYATIQSFLEEKFGADIAELRRFYSFFTRNVKLIRIKTQSVAHALKIFETINDRGKGLDSMDLLKNLLFMHARAGDFERLKEKWKELVDVLYGAGQKPLRFLRYFIFASYDVDRLKEEEIYTWFVQHEELCNYKRQPIAFAEQLLAAARAYVRFLKGHDPWGQPNRYLENMRYLSGSARQHLILLLGARHLPADLFVELCRHVENLFFCYIITRENTREFERLFAQWTVDLRKVTTQQELEQFLAERFEPAKQSLSQRFDLTFQGLSANAIQKYRMRYVLAKLTQYVNEQGFGTTGAASSLGTFINSQVEVEHILPQSPKVDVLAEFDQPGAVKAHIPRLGNLTLVEKSINASLGNKPFSKKRPVYTHSQFLLTKSIGERVVIGANTAIDRAVRKLEPAEEWTTEAISKRQTVLGTLARRVWDMPEGVVSQ